MAAARLVRLRLGWIGRMSCPSDYQAQSKLSAVQGVNGDLRGDLIVGPRYVAERNQSIIADLLSSNGAPRLNGPLAVHDLRNVLDIADRGPVNGIGERPNLTADILPVYGDRVGRGVILIVSGANHNGVGSRYEAVAINFDIEITRIH